MAQIPPIRTKMSAIESLDANMPYNPTGRPPGRPKKKPYDGKIGDRPNLSQQKWRALTRELQGVRDWEREPWPSSASSRSIADHVGVSHQTICNWRKDPAYRQGLIWLVALLLNEIMGSTQPSKALQDFLATKRSNLVNFQFEIGREWKGPVVCLACGETFEEAGSYSQHMEKHLTAQKPTDRFVWIGDDLIGWQDDKKNRQVGLLSPFSRGFS